MCAGTQPEARLPVFRESQFTLIFFYFFWFFFNSSFNHIWTLQMKSQSEARCAKAAWFPSLWCPIPDLLWGCFQAVLTDYMAIWLLQWYEIEHYTLNSSGQTQERFVKLRLSNCKWSIFHSLMTKGLFLEWWEVITYTLTSSTNCRVKEANLNLRGTFDPNL